MARRAILKGVVINDGSIIKMRSMVTKDVPATSIVAGILTWVIREIALGNTHKLTI